MKIKCVVLCLMAAVLFGGPLFGQAEESPADKFSFGLEFNASLVSVDNDGVIDSMADAAFNGDETKIGAAYEDEMWGVSAALKFTDLSYRIFFTEGYEDSPLLSIDELYAWVKPFGEHFKFTGGIFTNTDGVNDYTDDIDIYGMGPFQYSEEGEYYTEADEWNNPALTSGFLTDLMFGPVTLQLLLAPNYSKESATVFATGGAGLDEAYEANEANGRWYRIGGRAIVDVGVGTFAAHFKTFEWPIDIVPEMGGPWPGTKVNWTGFGAYFDLTAVENLGVTLGYAGFLPSNDGSDIDNVLFNGIDLRATWTGIEGLSLSTHNNLSFAKGAKNHWLRVLGGDDSSFFLLFNAIGATKELTDKFSINAVISNVYAKAEYNAFMIKFDTDTFGVSAKLIVKVSDNAEFNIGAGLDITKAVSTDPSGMAFGTTDDVITTFSVPVGIKVNF